jgi:tripartite-type tricarboxylate transporter receptor subunit TctC
LAPHTWKERVHFRKMSGRAKLEIKTMRFARSIGCVTLAIVGILASNAGWSQEKDWPQRPVKIVVPFAAGGSSDILGRIVADGLSATMKGQFFVENRTGGGGSIGATYVMQSSPDGYTLLVSGVASHVAGPAINPSIKYDPIKDFSHIAMLGGEASVLVVHPSLGVKTSEELVEKAKKEPLVWAASSFGALAHLAGEYFQQLAGIKMRHVPYKGGSAAVADVVAGHVKVGIFPPYSAGQHMRSGALIPLAIMSAERNHNLPNVPTFKESGYPQVVMASWFALSGPKGMDPAFVARLNRAVRDVLDSPAVKKRMAQDSSFRPDMDPAELVKYYALEVERWRAVAQKANLVKR